MAKEDKYIPSKQRTSIDDDEIAIAIFYAPEGYIDLIFFVTTIDTIREGVKFIGGDLGYSYDNITAIFEINHHGDLIINDINPSLYSIDNEGYLILNIN